MYFGKVLGLNWNPILPDFELQESVKFFLALSLILKMCHPVNTTHGTSKKV